MRSPIDVHHALASLLVSLGLIACSASPNGEAGPAPEPTASASEALCKGGLAPGCGQCENREQTCWTCSGSHYTQACVGSCGGANELCCDSPTPCGSGMECSNGECTLCGGHDQPCCGYSCRTGGDFCEMYNVPVSTCETCKPTWVWGTCTDIYGNVTETEFGGCSAIDAQINASNHAPPYCTL